jgi:hydroxymethylpyrimidine/phosphomethylpyrimidine kinase
MLDRKAHGSGCTLSALITAFLAKGMKIMEAVKMAKRYEWVMIDRGYEPGKGMDVVNQGAIFASGIADIPPLQEDRLEVWLELRQAIEDLIPLLIPEIIPEVGMNFAYALPNAISIEDVCSSGRIITNATGKIVRTSGIDFGESRHMASMILECMKKDPSKRCAINIRFSKKIVDLCDKMGYSIGKFDREMEPVNVSTMEWGTKMVVDELGKVPDIIWDRGGIGKEAMIRIIGENPDDILEKLKKILKNF